MSHHFITFSNVHYCYPNGYEALKGINFTITHGEKVALLGDNGAGKSTLLLHCNGLLLPSSGTVNVGDIPITKKTLLEIRRNVGIIFQNSDDQLFMPTVEEDVAFGPLNMGLPDHEVARRVEMALNMVDSWHLRKRSPGQLSGGQQKCVAIATVLSMEPNILVMDEPTCGLDAKTRSNLINTITGFRHTCLIATHDIDLALSVCPRSIVMHNGHIIADGATRQILADRELPTYST